MKILYPSMEGRIVGYPNKLDVSLLLQVFTDHKRIQRVENQSWTAQSDHQILLTHLFNELESHEALSVPLTLLKQVRETDAEICLTPTLSLDDISNMLRNSQLQLHTRMNIFPFRDTGECITDSIWQI